MGDIFIIGKKVTCHLCMYNKIVHSVMVIFLLLCSYEGCSDHLGVVTTMITGCRTCR